MKELELYNLNFYFSLCTSDEVERIKNVSNSADYLLKIRANATIEHIRIHRVLLAAMRRSGNNWSLSSYFDDSPFEDYIDDVSEQYKEHLEGISGGFVFCNDPNGRILKTDYGCVITISESLKYFLYYMNLAFLTFDDCDVPDDVRIAALRIAIRTMMQKESMDFEIDPRGIIPSQIDMEIRYHVNDVMKFIVGHEYSHYVLGHLNDESTFEASFLTSIDTEEVKHKFFSYDQKDELAADIHSLRMLSLSKEKLAGLIQKVCIYFVFMDIYSNVKDQVSPSLNFTKTHPEPMDRLRNIIEEFKEEVEIDYNEMDKFIRSGEVIKDFLQDDAGYNFDEIYDFHGSIYLGQWRGKPLIDRVDY